MLDLDEVKIEDYDTLTHIKNIYPIIVLHTITFMSHHMIILVTNTRH